MPGPWNTGGSAASEDMPRKPGTEHREPATIGRRKDKQTADTAPLPGGSTRWVQCRRQAAPRGCHRRPSESQSISDAPDRFIFREIGWRSDASRQGFAVVSREQINALRPSPRGSLASGSGAWIPPGLPARLLLRRRDDRAVWSRRRGQEIGHPQAQRARIHGSVELVIEAK